MKFKNANFFSKIKRKITSKISLPSAEKSFSQSLMGLDIRPGFVRLIKVSSKDDGLYVDSIFETEDDNEDIKEISGQLRDYISEAHHKTSFVNMALRNEGVKVEFDNIPYMDSRELDKLMQARKERLGSDKENNFFDYAVLGETDVEGNKRLLVVMVNVPRKIVFKNVALIESVALRPFSMEIPSFSLARLLFFNEDLKDNSSYILIDIDKEVMHITTFLGKMFCLYRRVFSAGERNIINIISNELGIETLQAKKIKEEINLDNMEKFSSEERRVYVAIESILKKRTMEIDRFIQYFMNIYPSVDIDKIFVTGKNLIKGIEGYIRNENGVKAEIIEPFKKIKLSENIDLSKERKYSYATAVGLALKGFVR